MHQSEGFHPDKKFFHFFSFPLSDSPPTERAFECVKIGERGPLMVVLARVLGHQKIPWIADA
jgi:hypothetical protein